MTRWIVGSSLKFRLLVIAAAAATMVVGFTQLRETPVDVLPEFGPTTVEVQTEALGLSAAEVEQLITVPLEQDLLNGVAFLDEIRSQSIPGLARIQLIFEPGTDLYRARQVVNERVAEANVALPGVSKPTQMLQPLSSTNRVMMIGVNATSVSPLELSVLARWTIVPRLTGLEGVANVSVWGHRDRQLQVQVDPERLRDQNVTLAQIIETSGNALWVSPLSFVEASTPGTGGFIDTPNQRLGVQHLSPISTPADLAAVRLEGTPGRQLRLGDVANVVEGHQPLIGDAVVGDGNAETENGRGLLLVVEKFPEANALDVTERIEAAIASMAPGLGGVEFDTTVYRPASYIQEGIDNLTLTLMIGAALAALLIGAVVFRWRTAVVALVAIPVSLVTAALVLHAFGHTMNEMVLAGLMAGLVLVVHEAVVAADSIARRLREQRRDESTASVILDASLEVRGPLVYGTLIVVLAAVPLFFLEGVSGAFFPSIAVAFFAALAASTAVALTVAPAVAVLLHSKAGRERGEAALARRLRGGYDRVLATILNRRRAEKGAYLAAGALVVAALATVPFLSQSLLPTMKESQLLIRWEGAPGTSLPEMNRITKLAARELRSLDGIQNVGANVGRAVASDQIVSANAAEIWVSIDPGADYDATVKSVENVVSGYPGLSRTIQSFSNERVERTLAGTEDDLAVRIYGEDLSLLGKKAGEVRKAVAGVDGLVDERIKFPVAEPTLEVEVDIAAAERHGVKPGEVRRAAATLLSGIGVGSLFEDQKVFDVVVWGTPETRNSLSSVRELLIDTPSGHVRLDEVADVRIAPNPAAIEHQAVSRYVDVAANVQGRDVGSVVRDVERAIDGVAFPLEYHAEVLAAEGQHGRRLVAIGIAAALGILLLFQAAFGSWRRAALAFATLPIALAGGLLAAAIAGGTLSFGSYIGLFAVFGLAARNGILLFDRYERGERHDAFGADLVRRGALDTAWPVLATAVATALALIPLVVLGSAPGLEVVQPMAVVVLGGLVTSTLLSLFVMPALYLRLGLARIDPVTRQLDA